MQKIQPIEYGSYYHIYNRGINSCTIFSNARNYDYFLKLYDKHISLIADTFAWVLMPNHFHFLVRIKEKENIVSSVITNGVEHLSGFENLTGEKPPYQYFSNLFNAYTKAYNKQNNRHGSLFERPFKRKQIDTDNYLKYVLLYIHNNPVHHGFTENIKEYPWSSYLSCISVKPTKIKREIVVNWFENLSNFKHLHESKSEFGEIDEWLGL